jgi:hypothetical protein
MQMKWGDVKLNVGHDNVEFLEFNERISKTRQGTSRDIRAFQPKMFANGINLLNLLCLYIQKLQSY